jgi:hypothetical protein
MNTDQEEVLERMTTFLKIKCLEDDTMKTDQEEVLEGMTTFLKINAADPSAVNTMTKLVNVHGQGDGRHNHLICSGGHWFWIEPVW